MQARFLLLTLVFLPGCSFLPFVKQLPFQIKAVIEGEIKGHKIHCEKNLDVANGKWGIMCSIGNDMDIKYRVRPIANEQTQLEFVVEKSKEGQQKVIAAPTVIVKKAQSTRNITTTANTHIMIVAELIK
jgi:hypothetical protein